MPRVFCFLNLWKGGANRRTVTAFGWLVALAWTVWKNPQERTVLHGIRWFWSPFSWASSRRNKHIIWVFTKLCFVECLLQSQVGVTCPIKYHVFIYWLFCLRWCRDAAVSLNNTFFLRVFYLHSSILSHLFILNISLVFLVIILALQRKEVVCLFSDKCEFFPLLQGVVTA